MGRVRGPGCEINEGRLAGRQGLLVLDPGPRLVRHVGHEVVVRILRQFDLGNPVEQERGPLVRLTADEAVEFVEALMRRPAVEGAGDADFPGGGLVPLAEGPRTVAVQAQHFRQRSRRVGDLTRVTRERGGHLGDEAHVDRVMVAAGFQGGPGGRTQGGGMEIVVAQSVLRQAVEGRGTDRTAEGTRDAEPQVVDQDDHHVGSAGRGLDFKVSRRLYLARVELLVQRPLRLLDRQHRAIHFNGPACRRCGDHQGHQE